MINTEPGNFNANNEYTTYKSQTWGIREIEGSDYPFCVNGKNNIQYELVISNYINNISCNIGIIKQHVNEFSDLFFGSYKNVDKFQNNSNSINLLRNKIFDNFQRRHPIYFWIRSKL